MFWYFLYVAEAEAELLIQGGILQFPICRSVPEILKIKLREQF